MQEVDAKDIPHLVREPASLRVAREILGMSAEQLAQMVQVEGGGRTVRRWEAGESVIPGPVTVIMETAMSCLAQRAGIMRQIEMIETGELRSGSISWVHPTGVDTTAENLETLKKHKRIFEESLEILTRGIVTEPGGPDQVHYYRLLSLDNPRQKQWSHPGEKSAEAALSYFAKQVCPGRHLVLCTIDDLRAEYALEKLRVIRTQHGGHYRIQPGELVDTLSVRTV